MHKCFDQRFYQCNNRTFLPKFLSTEQQIHTNVASKGFINVTLFLPKLSTDTQKHFCQLFFINGTIDMNILTKVFINE